MTAVGKSARFAALLLAGTGMAGIAHAQTVTGHVADSTGTRSLQGALVEVVENGRSTVSGPDGGFRFPDLTAGNYTLRTSYSGAASVETSVTVPETGEVNVNVVVGGDDGTILVIGQYANLASSLSRQRNSDTVDTVLSRDAIGQFPDQNVAEALRRAPGVNILNDQGEGRFVSIRGLDPNLNSSSINGVRVPAPESDIRAVALDVIPSELVESITIRKSLTPDMDGDTLGGSIEIATTSPFDRRRDFLAVSLSGSYNDLRSEVSPRGSFDFSTRITPNFGISGGLSYFRRRFSTDNMEADGWDITDGGIVYADTLEFRDYDVQRTRIGSSLSLEWRPTPSTTLYARGLYSRFEDVESRAALTFEFDEEPSSGTAGSSATFLSGDGEISVQRALKDREETQEIYSLVVGGETETGPWRLRYSASYSRASERENGSIDPITFEQGFDDPGALAVTIGGLNTYRPNFSIGVGSADFLDPSEYEFDGLDRTTLSDSVDEEWGARFDVTRTFPLTQGSLDLQFGGRLRMRDKGYNLTLDTFDGYDDDFTLADILGRQSYGLAAIEPIPGVGPLRAFLRSGFANFERDDASSDFDSAVEDYSVGEDIYAGYAMLRLDTGPWRVIAGGRVEHTENDIRGNFVELVEEGGTRNGVELDEDTVFVSPLQFSRSYTDFLPSINVRYAPTRELVFRAGAYRTVVRPNIADLAPRFTVEENDEGDREGEFGNPDLTPYRAWNADLTAEYYFGRNAAIQIGGFWKQIDDFIVRREFEDVTFNGVFADEGIIPINGDEARVLGFEFSYQQALTFLPGFLGGTIVTLNYTYTDAEGDIGDRSIPLPASSEHTFNAVLGYERGPISLRLAGVYRSGYLDELGDSAEEDRYVRNHFQLDASARYRITPNVQVFAELSNGLDEPYIAYQRGPGANRLLQFERYSWTGNFGVRANF